MLGLLLLFACNEAPRSWEDCSARSGVARDDCHGRMFPRAFCEDPARAEALVREHVKEPAVRDFIWHQVTLEVDPRSARWCAKIGDAAVRERCESIVKRPHLQRGVTPLCAGAGPVQLQATPGAPGQVPLAEPPPGTLPGSR